MTWLLPHLAVTAMLAGAVHVVTRLTRMGPVGRHALWVIVLIKLVVPPVVTMPLPWPAVDPIVERTVRPTTSAALDSQTADEIAPLPPTVPADVMSFERASNDRVLMSPPAPAPARFPLTIATFAAAWVQPQPLFVAIWTCGSLLFALVQGLRVFRLARRIRVAGRMAGPLEIIVQTIAREMRMTTCPVRLVPG